MLIMILENAPQSLRGVLSRFMIEPKTGVFVGKISALVRDLLWELCLKSHPNTSVIQIWSDANEQGFNVRSHGDTSRTLIDNEGLTLVALPDTSHSARIKMLLKKENIEET